jgi:hypothetical protein
MQNNINNNRDAFSESIRQKLENHRVTVDAECWDEIEARLRPKKKRRVIPFWFWLTGEAAVAVLALIFTLQPLSESSTGISKSEKHIKKERSNTKRFAEQQISSIHFYKTDTTKHATVNVQSKPRIVKSAVTHNQQIALVSGNNLIPTALLSNDTIQHKMLVETESNSSHKEEALAKTTATKNDSSISTKATKIIPYSLVDAAVKEPESKPKNKRNWLLAAVVGTSGSTMMNTGGNGNLYSISKDYNSLTTSNKTSSYAAVLSSAKYDKQSYLPPISFGFIIRKNLDEILSVETGLVYTYLSSTFENEGVLHYNAKLRLDYLGVPVNCVVKLWNKYNWEIYLSGGGMVEKGLKSTYTEEEHLSNQTNSTKSISSIDGLQWSINGTVGVAYKLERNWSIYFEPKISYFFDNNQPVSTRTDHPTTIGLSAGIRYQFK